MILPKINLRFSRVALAVFLLMNGISMGFAQAPVKSPGPDHHPVVRDFAGTWNWMFHDRRFSTMKLEPDDGQLTGAMTTGHMVMDKQGKITLAEEMGTELTTPLAGTLEKDGVLKVVVQAGEGGAVYAMTLTSPDTAELRLSGVGVPAHAEAIRLEKVWSEPPVAP